MSIVSSAIGIDAAVGEANEPEAAGVEFQVSLGVIRYLPEHAIEDAQIVGMLRDVGKKLRYVQPGLAMLLEFPGRTEQLAAPLAVVRLRA